VRGHRTVAELAQYLGVTSRTVERWYAAEKIPAPAYVDERGWKFWNVEQCKEILEWWMERKKTDRRC
jgi:excisionase family DNA binding protein